MSPDPRSGFGSFSGEFAFDLNQVTSNDSGQSFQYDVFNSAQNSYRASANGDVLTVFARSFLGGSGGGDDRTEITMTFNEGILDSRLPLSINLADISAVRFSIYQSNKGGYSTISGNSLRYVSVEASNKSGPAYAAFSISATAVPEPATWAMMLFGFGAVGHSMRNRRRRSKVLQAV